MKCKIEGGIQNYTRNTSISIDFYTHATVSREDTRHIQFHHFSQFVNYFAYFPKYYSIRTSSDPKFNLLTFKMLNKSKTGLLSRDEFYDIYKTLEFSWRLMKRQENPMDGSCCKPCSSIRKTITNWVRSLYFDYVINGIILLNIINIVLETTFKDDVDVSAALNYVECVFVLIYLLEMIIKIFGLGRSSAVSCS